ncbi:hypothetical protein PTQ27_01305 [Mannheimia sp. AT1]|uniref:Uncharacterized protein n=1 Tax=Mannheimia cairinae TaxID=3025936 RepID=A0ABT5MLQ4_9PAST|nr:hypothetical protein [Mannheimia cairinae]MDD0823111.1 hypothetical protein [Mannheimia cairinae]MDD0825864.1 hypothetical protein [Mannheimia cairinae]
MRCITAKKNPVLMRLAIKHYLENDKGIETPLFTFLSLFSDNEPYPLPELLITLGNRIAKLERECEEMPTETDLITLGILKKQLNKLLKVAERMKKFK